MADAGQERRVALVTGCGKHLGIGAAVAEALAGQGLVVVVSDLEDRGVPNFNEERVDNAESPGLTGLVEAIAAAGGTASLVTGDVSSEGDADRMVAETVDRYGRLDVLVNNAAAPQEPLLDIEHVSLEAWSRLIDVNLTGTFLMSRAAVPTMRAASWGRIINMSSVMGKKGRGQRLGYCASKAGVLGLTRALALEVAGSGLTVNAVCPGPILTTRALSSARRDGDLDENLRSGAERVPVGRMGTGMDVAAAVSFLASDASEFVTGHALDVDGGWGI